MYGTEESIRKIHTRAHAMQMCGRPSHDTHARMHICCAHMWPSTRAADIRYAPMNFWSIPPEKCGFCAFLGEEVYKFCGGEDIRPEHMLIMKFCGTLSKIKCG